MHVSLVEMGSNRWFGTVPFPSQTADQFDALPPPVGTHVAAAPCPCFLSVLPLSGWLLEVAGHQTMDQLLGWEMNCAELPNQQYVPMRNTCP